MNCSESIILSRKTYREADFLITFFSRDDGKLKGVARSAKKSKKRFAGLIETGYILNLKYDISRGMEMANIMEASLISPLKHRDYSLAETHALWLALEMALQYLPDAEPNVSKYNLLNRFLSALHEGRMSRAILIYFLTKWLSLAGFFPDFHGIENGLGAGYKLKSSSSYILKKIMAGDMECDIKDLEFKDLLGLVFKCSDEVLGRPLGLEQYTHYLMEL